MRKPWPVCQPPPLYASLLCHDSARSGPTGRGNLRRAPVMVMALLTYRYTGTDAADFWHAVAMDDRLAQNDPHKPEVSPEMS